MITYLLNDYNDIKERNTRKLLVLKLAEERDTKAEYLFGKISTQIKENKQLQSEIRNYESGIKEAEDSAKKYVIDKYFQGYWKNFNIQITLCGMSDSLMIKPENVNTACSDFFNNLINQTCKPTATSNLYYRQSESLTKSYIASIKRLVSSIKHQNSNSF